MKQNSIEEVFRSYFRWNVVAAQLTFLASVLFIFIVYQQYRVAEFKRQAESFFQQNKDYLLGLSMGPNYEGIQNFISERQSHELLITFSRDANNSGEGVLFPLSFGEKNFGWIKVFSKQEPLPLIVVIPFVLFVACILLLLNFVHGRFGAHVQRELVLPLKAISDITQRASDLSEIKKVKDLTSNVLEISQIRDALIQASDQIESSFLKLRQAEKEKAVRENASRVSHRIRSPLQSLRMIIESASGRGLLRQEKKQIDVLATEILDISGGVLGEWKEPDVQKAFLPQVIESVFNVKKTEFYGRHLQFRKVWGENLSQIFSEVNVSEFKSVIGSLINNAVESLPQGRGSVEINVSCNLEKILIVVSDTGVGMSPETIKKLGTRAFTSGKNGQGNGFGVYDAMNLLKKWGGSLSYQSRPGFGTKAVIELPKVSPPPWWPNEIRAFSQVLVCDDDKQVKLLWEGLIQTKVPRFSGGFHFVSSPFELRSWLKKNSKQGVLFLMDYEFKGSLENGLDLIQELKISDQAILVTGIASDPNIQERCVKLGVPLLPKGCEHFVPIVEDALKGEESYA